MPASKPLRMDGKIYPSARAAAGWLRKTGHPKASGAGICEAIASGRGVYLGREVEWAAESGRGMTREELRHRLQWAALPAGVRAELLAMEEADLRAMVAATVSGPLAMARAIGAGLVLAHGKEWLTQTMEPVNPA